jgi:hypothetical protein
VDFWLIFGGYFWEYFSSIFGRLFDLDFRPLFGPRSVCGPLLSPGLLVVAVEVNWVVVIVSRGLPRNSTG